MQNLTFPARPLVPQGIVAKFNPSRPNPGQREKKLTQIFIFTLLCGASKDFMKALKALTLRNARGAKG